jgi:formamidopyrimidine-DNA glycosylase
MPEGLEAEIWRGACEPLVGRTIVAAVVDDQIAPLAFVEVVTGSVVTGVRRVGKVVLLDVRAPAGRATPRSIGLHFGMTGRLVIDGVAAIERLSYASGRDASEWDRCVLLTDPAAAGGPALRFNDPRRLGRVTIDPDLSSLGVDLIDVTAARLGAALLPRHRALKTALLDQHVVAGLGNLLVDEMLWWSSLDPHRIAASLSTQEIRGLAGAIRRRLPIMLERGGSTTGVLSPEVRAAPHGCERDGCPLRRDVIGGRTTVWCPGHQC